MSTNFNRNRQRTRYRYLPVTLKPVEEVEGKCSPNDTPPDFGNERLEGGGYQANGGGTSSTSSSTNAAAVAGSSKGADGAGAGGSKSQDANRRASSSSHQSQQSDGHSGGHNSDSTSASKAPATSSGSPTDSPARLSEFSRSRSKSVGEQQWTNLRAVLAWYARLRRIKRSKSNQRWMKLRTTVQLTGAIQSVQKKAPLKREDSFLKRFSTRQIPEQDTFEIGDEDGGGGDERTKLTRKKKRSLPRSVVNPDGNFYFYWLMILTFCVLYNLWTLIVRQSFPELQSEARLFWIMADSFSDLVFLLDIAVQFRTGYLEQGLMVYKSKKLAKHYIGSKPFYFDLCSLFPTDLFQLYYGTNPMFRFPRFLKIYRTYNYYYMVESRTVYPNVWRVVNLIHILLLLAHWFGCFYFLLSEAEHFKGPWVYPDPKHPNNTDFAPLTRKYLGSLYWSTLTLTTIGDLPTPYSNWQLGNRSTPFNPLETSGFRTQAHKSRLLYIRSDIGYLFTIISYLIGVFIFATIVGQVGNVITNRNANRLEFERLLDGAKMYMRHHKVPRDMQRRVLRWYDYSWSRGRIQGGGDINTALGLLPDKLKTELALHVNLSVLKKVTIFQECQPEFLHDLVLKMKAYIFTPGDLICRKGEVAREMFIIADGILEVISEAGKVLTTMQAGDFFGEIGILNLDGLNKRTADVRSVGYSELFSLSREDVLAAMKDYPEAQEILQTLGRKRLMEARKASGGPSTKSKPSTSEVVKKAQALTLAAKEAETDSTTGKRIVEKLQSDFKGLKDVIRRSRKSNSSRDDSSEPESGKTDDGGEKGKGSFGSSRGVLKRMHNVLSDEKEKEPSTSTSTSTSSPSVLTKRGAGKRVQLAKILAQPQSPPKEPEIIGEGLPLFQRLRLLKQKEDRERKQQEEREAMMASLLPATEKPQSPPQPSSSSPTAPTAAPIPTSTAVPIPTPIPASTAAATAAPVPGPSVALPAPKKLGGAALLRSFVRTKASVEPPPPAATAGSSDSSGKEKLKLLTSAAKEPGSKRESISSVESGSISSPPSSSLVSRALSPPLKPGGLLIGEAAALAASRATTEPISISAPPMPPKLSSQISFSPPVSSGSMSPPVLDIVSVGRDRSASASSALAPSTIHPSTSSFMKPAALHFRQKTYGSVDDLSPEFSRLPFVKKLKILNERQKIAVLLMSKTKRSNVLTRSTSEGSNENTTVAGSEPPAPTSEDYHLHSVAMGRRTQSNQEQIQGGEEGSDGSALLSLSATPAKPSKKYDQSPPEREIRSDPVSDHKGGIQERSTTHHQATSSSAQPTSSSTCRITTTIVAHDSNTTKCLTKLGTDVRASSTVLSSTNSCKIPIPPKRLSPSPTSLHVGGGGAGSKKRKKTKKMHGASPTSEKKDDDPNSSSSSSSPPSPPELDSSETPERRNLKSILKRLAKSEESVESETKREAEHARRQDERKLLKAPTIEGYAARHRKFAKNVTFHRQAVTVVSPEEVGGTQIPPRPAGREPHQYRLTTPDALQLCQVADIKICDQPAEAGTGIGTQTEQLIPVCEHSYNIPDNLKPFTNLMLVKGEDLAYAGDRHPGAIQIGLNIAQEECIGSVFMGIKAIIQSKVDEIHSRFQDNFNTLEHEVHKRDEIIYRLQRRIQELERNSDRRRGRNGSGSIRGASGEEDPVHFGDLGGHEGDNEMDDIEGDFEDDEELLLGSEASMQRTGGRYPLELQTSYLFSRGDSIDTVISAQDYDDEVFERAELASHRGASQSLSQSFGEAHSGTSSGQHYHQQRQRSRDLGNGDGQQKHSSATWAQISEEETIEMREFGNAPWQVEFHRDRDSLPPPNERRFGTRNLDKDSVAVDIGNTSTEYESSSSEDAKGSKMQEIAHRRMKEEPVALDDDDEEGGDQTDVGSEEEETDDTSDDEPQLTNKNWEVQMLAKEMDKFEKTRPDNSEMLGEAQHLQHEIKQMREAVTSGELSPSELDMLESILQTKSKRVKAIAKALSVETPFPPSATGGRPLPSSVASQDSSRSKSKLSFVRSVDDLHGASSSTGTRPTASMSRSWQYQDPTHYQSRLPPSEMSHGAAYSTQPRLSLGILPHLSPAQPSTSSAAAASEKLSPGERRELHKLIFSRKRSTTTVRRQTSLGDPALHSTAAAAAAAAASSPSTAVTDTQRRRESAGAFPISVSSVESSTKSSFFSKFSLARQLTSRGQSKHPSSREPSTEDPSRVKYVCGSGESSSGVQPSCSSGDAGGSVIFQAGSLSATRDQHRASSITTTTGILPSISSTITTSVLSSSVQPPGGSLPSGSHITEVRGTPIGVASTSQQPATCSVTPAAESIVVTSTSSSGVSTLSVGQIPSSSAKSLDTDGRPKVTSDADGESQPLLKK